MVPEVGLSGYDCEHTALLWSYIIAGGMLELSPAILDHLTMTLTVCTIGASHNVIDGKCIFFSTECEVSLRKHICILFVINYSVIQLYHKIHIYT